MRKLKTGEDIVRFLLREHGSSIVIKAKGGVFCVTRKRNGHVVVQIPTGRLDGIDRKLRQYKTALGLNHDNGHNDQGVTYSLAGGVRHFLRDCGAISPETAIPIRDYMDRVYNDSTRLDGKTPRNLGKFLTERGMGIGVHTEDGHKIYLGKKVPSSPSYRSR